MIADLRQRVVATFLGAFDQAPTTLARAPGRVNLIGEHTDYNDGFVLPCAIDAHTLVAGRRRSDALVRVVAGDFGHAADEFRLDQPIERRAQPPWANYVRGVMAALLERGMPPVGMNLAIAGDVPRGAGLSSSASVELALAKAALALAGGPELPDTALAQACQEAENRYAGCQCGIMDQLISASGRAGHALLLDCRSLEGTAVPLPQDMAVMIVHSNVQRGLVDSAYNLRRDQCSEAARVLGVAALRDASMGQLEGCSDLMSPEVFRRARHVITENQRTCDAAAALTAGDLTGLGTLMAHSHASMRDDFEITVPAIDRLVEVLQGAIGSVGGARMTGGGFGGCAVALLPEERCPAVIDAVARHYRSPQGRPGTVILSRAVDGAQLIPHAA